MTLRASCVMKSTHVPLNLPFNSRCVLDLVGPFKRDEDRNPLRPGTRAFDGFTKQIFWHPNRRLHASMVGGGRNVVNRDLAA